MENQLVKIDCMDWERLRALYLPETPDNILGLATLSNYIRWNKQLGHIDHLAIYSLSGDWSDGTFAVMDRYHLYFDSLNESNDRLMNLLELLDYSKGVRIMHVRLKHYPVILEIIKRKQLQLEYDSENLLYYLSMEQAAALQIELPNGFYSRALNESDVKKANDDWLFNHPGSLFYLQRLSRLNPNSGIFTKNEDKLVSSVFQFQTGAIGTLYTDPGFRNCHLGQTVVKQIFKRIALELELSVIAPVNRHNLASRKIFEKIGCQIVDEIHWLAIPCEWTLEADRIRFE